MYHPLFPPKQKKAAPIVDRHYTVYQESFYWKESDEFVLHSESLRDPFKVEKRVSVSLMVLGSVQSMNDGAKDEEP